VTSLPFFDGTALEALLPMADAIDVLESTFAMDPPPAAPPRIHLDMGRADLLLMPAWGDRGTGVKLITVDPANPARGLPLIHGIYVLFDPATHAPRALFDGAGLTRLRTAAVSGVATRHLARSDARCLVVFGAGVQAAAHIDALRAVRPLTRVVIVSPSDASSLAARSDAEVGTPDAVRDADIVCTCTTSSTPVFDGRLLRPGTHVNAIGAYTPGARELDDAAIASGRLVVETKAAALSEAGDLIMPIGEGLVDPSAVEELGDVVRGNPRRTDAEITIFKSVGVAFEDLAVAAAAYERSAG
jgi:ornithine cyclodeaminase